jgi:hypothetical protein
MRFLHAKTSIPGADRQAPDVFLSGAPDGGFPASTAPKEAYFGFRPTRPDP